MFWTGATTVVLAGVQGYVVARHTRSLVPTPISAGHLTSHAQPLSHAIAFYCGGMHIARRVRRLQPTLRARGWTAVIVTPRPGIWFYGKLGRIPVFLMSRYDGPRPEALDAAIQGDFALGVWSALRRAHETIGIEAAAVWGTGPIDPVVRNFATTHGLAELHFELGNVVPKTFMDPDGVSTRARVARHPALLDRYAITDAEIEAWRKDFVAQKLRQVGIPQQPRWYAFNPWFVLDVIASLFLSIPQQEPLGALKKIKRKYALWRRRFEPPVPEEVPRTSYVFLPLQVSSDANVRLFAKVDNFDAIRIAADRAKGLNCALAIKPHPAESDSSVLTRIREVCGQHGYLLTSANTAALILGASEVVTINSSVGLEARLMGKPVTCLGDAVYANFSDRQAAVFAMCHLIPFSPFGVGPAPAEAVDRILDLVRAERGT